MNEPVLITNPARPRDHGSGFVIRRLDGTGSQVVTCSHVVRALGTDGLQVAGQPAKLVIDLVGDGVDLAVLAVPGLTEFEPVTMQAGVVGDEVELFGFEPAGGGPLAVPHRGRLDEPSLTALGGKNRPAWRFVLGEGEIEGGHSGGPVVSVRTGHVVGVISMGPDQKGGKDGVAVAIENLRLWKDAPAIARAAAVVPVEVGETSESGKSLLPEIVRPARRWWVFAIVGAGVAVAAATLLVRAWSSGGSSPPPPCAMPDLHQSFEAAPVESWCPHTIVGRAACRQTFPDERKGTDQKPLTVEVKGTCLETLAVDDWTAIDRDGNEWWQAHFDDRGQPTGGWHGTRVAPSNAVFTTTLEHHVAVPEHPGQFVTTRIDEVRCHRRTGDSTVTTAWADVAGNGRSVTLSVPGGTFACALVRVGGVDLTSECRSGLRKVSGEAAADAYTSFLDARRAVENCQDAALPTLPACGDHIQNTGEQCDDGGASARCTEYCKLSSCGDGVLNRLAGEACDPGAHETRTCNDDCTKARCGDGKTNAAADEVCDSGGVATKKCEVTCQKPVCGDGKTNAPTGEQCDTGSALNSATCLGATCKLSRCGDGKVNAAAGEECDDGRATRKCTDKCMRPVLSPLPGATPRLPGATTPTAPLHGTGVLQPSVVHPTTVQPAHPTAVQPAHP